MQSHIDAETADDLHAVWGSRYNAVVPSPCDPAERSRFPQSDERPGHGFEEDAERWDGLA